MSAHALSDAPPRARMHHLASFPKLAVLAAGYSGQQDQIPTPNDDPEMLVWLHSRAFDRGGAIHAAVMVDALPLTTWARPRGLGWADYPVVSDMAYRIDPSTWGKARVHHGPADRIVPSHVLDAPVALRGAEVIAIMLTGPWFSSLRDEHEEAVLAQHLRVLRAAGVGDDTSVMVVRLARAPYFTTLGALARFCADALARDRLTFSYGVNASVIHGRVLADILDRKARSEILPPEVRCLPGDDLSLRQARDRAREGMISDLGSPLGLQVLYRLRRLGGEGCPPTVPGRSHTHRKYPGFDLHALGGGTDEDGNAVWTGTGRYPPVALDEHRMELIQKAVRRFMLADVVPDGVAGAGNLALTETGLAFLDALHPDNEDPDCLNRWASPGTPDVAAMDSWVLRNFRKAKHRIAQAEAANPGS